MPEPNDNSSTFDGVEPAEPAQPAKPAPPAEPAGDGGTADVADGESSCAPASAPLPAPAPGAAQPPSPYAMPAQAAPRQVPPPPAAPLPYAPPAQPYSAQATSPYAAQPSQPAPYGNPPASPYGGNPYASSQPMGAPSEGGKAMAALICGVLSIVLSGTVVPGIVLGIVAIVLASQYVRTSGYGGKATGGRVCGIVGLVFSGCALLFWISIFAVALASIDDYDTYSSSYSSAPATDFPVPVDSPEDEAAILLSAGEALSAGTNQELIPFVTEKADRSFQSSTGYSLLEAGINPTEFAEWLMEGMTIDFDAGDVFVFDDGTGTAYATVTCRTMYGFTGELMSDMNDFESKSKKFPSDEELAAKLSEFSQDALESAPQDEAFVALDLKKQGDSWVVTGDSLQNAVKHMFSLY